MNDLEKLIPIAVDLSAGGELLAIKPLKVGQMPAFLRAIAPVMQHLTRTEIDWLTLFGEQGDDLLAAIAIAVAKPRLWVDDLAADEAIVLAAKVIEVNADFFTRTVLPKLDGLFKQAKGLGPLAAPVAALAPEMAPGSMPSSAS